MIKKFNDFIKESVNDKYALLDILREWGVFNPLEFMKYLEELGYTIIELDPVGTNESVNYDDDDLYDISDEEELEEALEFGNIDSLDRLREELGYVIIKNEEINEGMDIDDFKDKIKRKMNPSLIDTINKIGMIMTDVDYNGLRSNMKPSSAMTDKEQYEHVVKYAYFLKKAIKLFHKLEKRIEKIEKKRRLTDEEQSRFNRLIRSIIDNGGYRYPWKFEGYLSDFDQDALDEVVVEINKLANKYGGKTLSPKKKEKN